MLTCRNGRPRGWKSESTTRQRWPDEDTTAESVDPALDSMKGSYHQGCLPLARGGSGTGTQLGFEPEPLRPEVHQQSGQNLLFVRKILKAAHMRATKTSVRAVLLTRVCQRVTLKRQVGTAAPAQTTLTGGTTT